ncbi:nucleotidyltransferase domain-containing protein [Spirosoma pollinicola]|uniref:Nucleotidyltransferase domain-containing protein n=1 Tax=Spirosoma pollinicola TaxID=2057025 RepID=A0A2K8Z949_9BACT|nr:nucleotidyltransferase domain-containing protein [Spirosoma pollinicola]AUD06392.1 nucleotidyltransferase domain-containing protein [Spirosoma pollinicola]
MKYGLTAENLTQITQVFKRNPAVLKVYLYGSRAMGTNRPGSDIDLAVSGNQLTFNDFLNLTIQLEELDLLYVFDVQHLDKIKNPDMLNHINRVGIPIYVAMITSDVY